MKRKVGRPGTGRWPNASIRINPVALQRARDVSIRQKKTLGKWLEEAIIEKADREDESNRESKK